MRRRKSFPSPYPADCGERWHFHKLQLGSSPGAVLSAGPTHLLWVAFLGSMGAQLTTTALTRKKERSKRRWGGTEAEHDWLLANCMENLPSSCPWKRNRAEASLPWWTPQKCIPAHLCQPLFPGVLTVCLYPTLSAPDVPWQHGWVVLKVWSLDQQHQLHLGISTNASSQASPGSAGSAVWVWTSPAEAWESSSSLRTTALANPGEKISPSLKLERSPSILQIPLRSPPAED
jgi:hypothetical protein